VRKEDAFSLMEEAGRHCFREPIPEIFEAARYLDNAVTAYFDNRPDNAADLIRLADKAEIREWVESLWGAKSRYVHYRLASSAPVPSGPRVSVRMPGAPKRPFSAVVTATIVGFAACRLFARKSAYV